MRRSHIALTTLIAAGTLAAGCSDDPLSVPNRNNPNADALLSTASGTETIVSKLAQQMFNGQYGASDAIWPQTTVMGLESEATVANFGMNTRGAIPRLPISNVQGNDVNAGNNRDYSFLTRNVVLAARAINALDGSPSSFPAADFARNKAFAYFALGYGLGHLSLVYDSVAVITPARAAAGDTVPGFSGPTVANTTALQMLDSAVAIATSPSATAGSGWNMPALWLASASSGPSRDEFVRIVRSFRARIRANVGRTPAERQAVNWQAVYDDAAAGIQTSLVVALGPGKGWTNAWVQQAAVSGGWHQMPYWILGMADTSGAYQAWLQQGLGNKQPFLIVTPDKRFPQGTTRAAQQAFQDPIRGTPGGTVYFRNRPSGEDTPGAPSGLSWYDNFRFYAVRQNNGADNWVWFARAENDMLGAEAALRLGRFADATALIDRYRVPNGLPSVAGLNSLTATVPGGSGCVPRVPTGGGATACGSLFEAMKYEKRIETAFTGFAAWFLDSRGWGDLVRGTAIEWPAPYQETDARSRPYYNNTRTASGPGTYAFVP